MIDYRYHLKDLFGTDFYPERYDQMRRHKKPNPFFLKMYYTSLSLFKDHDEFILDVIQTGLLNKY